MLTVVAKSEQAARSECKIGAFKIYVYVYISYSDFAENTLFIRRSHSATIVPYSLTPTKYSKPAPPDFLQLDLLSNTQYPNQEPFLNPTNSYFPNHIHALSMLCLSLPPLAEPLSQIWQSHSALISYPHWQSHSPKFGGATLPQ